MIFLNMSLTNFKKLFSSSNLFKLILISTMTYQLIDVTIKYLKYPTIIKSDLKYFESGDLPWITICRENNDWHFERKINAENYKSKGVLYVFLYPITGNRWGIQLNI